MKSSFRWLLLLLLPLGAAQPGFSEESTARRFEVRILNDVADCPTPLHFRIEGLISGCWHSHDLSISATSTMQLLLACGGYEIVTHQVVVGAFEAQGSWDVELSPLPRQRVHGRATVDDNQLPGNRPLGNGVFERRYTLKEAMPYFGYVDGAVPEINLGSFETNETGEFEMQLPVLQQDPWIDSDHGNWVHIVPVAEQAAGWDEKVEGLRWSLQELLTAPVELRFEAIRSSETPR